MLSTASEGGAGTAKVLGTAETRVHRIEWRDDGILRAEFVEGAYCELEDSVAAFRTYGELTDAPPYYLLADIRNLKGASSAARAHGSDPEFVAAVGGIAILVKGAVSRTIGNIFLRLTRPPYPSRMFTDEVAATLWLHRVMGRD